MRERSVLLTGYGCVLPRLTGIQEFWDAFCRGESQIGDEAPPRLVGTGVPAFGQVTKEQTKNAMTEVPFRLRHHASEQTTWGVAAANQAFALARLSSAEAAPGRIGIFTAQGEHMMQNLGSFELGLQRAMSDGSFDARRFAEDSLHNRGMHPFTVTRGLSNNLLAIVSMALDIQGDCGAFGSGDGAGLAALQSATSSVRNGYCDVALVVATGSVKEAFVLSDQYSEGRLSRHSPGRCALRPFDRSREGTVLGEGAVALLLESADHAEVRKAAVKAEIVPPATRVHAFRTADRANVYAECVDDVMASAHQDIGNVDVICADAKGLVEEDADQAAMIERAFLPRHRAVPVTCPTAVTGFISAVSELLGVATAALLVESGTIPPITNLEAPIATGLDLVMGEPRRRPCRQAVVLGSGDSGIFSAVLVRGTSAEWGAA